MFAARLGQPHSAVCYLSCWSCNCCDSRLCKCYVPVTCECCVSRHAPRHVPCERYVTCGSFRVVHCCPCKLRSWLVSLAVTRGLYVLLEQPLNSLFFKHPSVQCALELVQAKRFVTFLGAFGSASPKPLELFTTAPSGTVNEYLIRGGRACRQVLKHPSKLTLRRGRKKKWVCGTALLRKSQEYPPSFCKAYAALVHKLLPHGKSEHDRFAESQRALEDILVKASLEFQKQFGESAMRRVTFTRKLRSAPAGVAVDLG